MERIAAGDPKAEAELVETFSRGVTFLLRRLTGDRELSDDLHQETFRLVLEKVRQGEVREPARLSGFIRSTARNLTIAEYRRAERRLRAFNTAPLEGRPATGPNQLDEVLRAEDRQRVRRLLGELSTERDRQVLYRFHMAQESKERICASLGLTSRQFNVVLHRARQRFRELVERCERRQGLEEASRRAAD